MRQQRRRPTAVYPGDIILEQRAKSSRNTERHQIGLVGDLIPDSRATSLGISNGTAELPALVRNSREYHAHRAASHQPGSLIPIPNANHYTGMEELRSPNGILTRSAIRLMEDVS